MYAKFALTFILFSFTSAMTESEVSEHAKFSNEYHRILRETLEQTSQVFESQRFDITDGKFNMKWDHHKKVPTLKFDFYVIVEDESVCHLSFELDSHLAHVPETMKQESNNENVSNIVQEVRACGQKILNKGQPEDTQSLTSDILNDFQSHLDNSISEESRKSVESALQNKLDELESQKNLEIVQSSNSSQEETEIPTLNKNLSEESEILLNYEQPSLKKQKAQNFDKQYCSVQVKEIIKTHLKNLVFQNLIQDVKIFDENIKQCQHKQETDKYIYDSILQFNREKCYLRTKLQNGKITVMTNEYQESKFLLNLNDNKMINCIERFATIELLTK